MGDSQSTWSVGVALEGPFVAVATHSSRKQSLAPHAEPDAIAGRGTLLWVDGSWRSGGLVTCSVPVPIRELEAVVWKCQIRRLRLSS